MKIVKEIGKIWKKEVKVIDIWYFLQGMWRYRLYYNSKLQGVAIRKHIREQIDYRIGIMNPVCYDRGSCIKCGCMTTALQMCDKSCNGNCYPAMLNKKDWNSFKSGESIILGKNKTVYRYVHRSKDDKHKR